MSNLLLIALLIVCVIGALFTTVIAIGVGVMCHENKKAVDEIRTQMDLELYNIKEFDMAVTDCISNIDNALNEINARTNWLDGIDTQISEAFNQNKDRKES